MGSYHMQAQCLQRLKSLKTFHYVLMLEDYSLLFVGIAIEQSQGVKSLHLGCLHFIVISERYYFLKVSSKRPFLLSFFYFLIEVLLVAMF